MNKKENTNVGTIIAHETVNGIKRMVQLITYTNGKTVKRILGADDIPIDIIHVN